MSVRQTPQKEQVYQSLLALDGHHPSADDVYQEVHRQLPNISRTTVYRILNNLADQQQIVKTNVGDLPTVFESNLEPHAHFICQNCQEITDLECWFDNKEMKKLVAWPKNYQLGDFYLSFSGLCPQCKNQKK